MKLVKNKNYIEYEEKMVFALIRLLKKDSTKHITVADLIKEANVTRTTFYLHFKSVEDVYKLIAKKVADKYSSLLSTYKNTKDLANNLLPSQMAIANEINKNYDFYKLLANSTHFGEFVDLITKDAFKKLYNVDDYKKAFGVEGSLEWVSTRMHIHLVISSNINAWVFALRTFKKVDFTMMAYFCADFIFNVNAPYWKQSGLVQTQKKYWEEYLKIADSKKHS